MCNFALTFPSSLIQCDDVCRGTESHMAPEVRRGDRATAKADIFSFGVLMWELQMLRAPDGSQSEIAELYTLDADSDVEDSLMRACLRPIAAERPSAKVLQASLADIIEA